MKNSFVKRLMAISLVFSIMAIQITAGTVSAVETTPAIPPEISSPSNGEGSPEGTIHPGLPPISSENTTTPNPGAVTEPNPAESPDPSASVDVPSDTQPSPEGEAPPTEENTTPPKEEEKLDEGAAPPPPKEDLPLLPLAEPLTELRAAGITQNIVYVSMNGTSSGTGEESNPVNTIETALSKLPSEGGTIIISGSGVVQLANNRAELTIDKPATIRGNGSASVIISGAITLGADVTFETIDLNFNGITDGSDPYNRTIFANGHNLTIGTGVDTKTTNSAYVPTVYTGGESGSSSGDATVRISSGMYDNIYAGNASGTYSGSSTIDVSSSVEVRQDSNSGSISATNTTGDVSITLSGAAATRFTKFDGGTGGGARALTFNNYSNGSISPSALRNFDSVSVNSSILSNKSARSNFENLKNLSVSAGSTLELNEALTISGNLTGGGTLKLPRSGDAKLQAAGEISGTTAVSFEGDSTAAPRVGVVATAASAAQDASFTYVQPILTGMTGYEITKTEPATWQIATYPRTISSAKINGPDTIDISTANQDARSYSLTATDDRNTSFIPDSVVFSIVGDNSQHIELRNYLNTTTLTIKSTLSFPATVTLRASLAGKNYDKEIQITKGSSDMLPAPQNLRWTGTTAEWNEVVSDLASIITYTVKLYEWDGVKLSSQPIDTTEGLQGSSVDFSTLIQQNKAYKFTVQATDFSNRVSPSVVAESDVYGTPTTPPTDPAISGTLSISGTAAYGATLTASLSADTNATNPSYTWYRNGTQVGTGAAYKISAQDVSSVLTVKASSDNTTGEIEKSTSAVAKAAPQIATPPSSAIQYGQSLARASLTGGRVINPHDSAVVSGSWTWENDSTRPVVTGAHRAVFAPTDTALYTTPAPTDVTVTVNAAEPAITITATPTSQIVGQTVVVSATVKNPHDAAFTEGLPAPSLSYQIGSGAKQPISGGQFMIPSGTAVGTTITVTANTPEVVGKYAAKTGSTAVTVTNKTVIDSRLTLTMAGWTYGDAPNAPTLTGYTASGTPIITYMYSGTANDGTKLTNSTQAPAAAGSYTVLASYNDDTQVGSKTADFVIARKALTPEFSADNTIKPFDGNTTVPDAVKPVIILNGKIKDDLPVLADTAVFHYNTPAVGTGKTIYVTEISLQPDSVSAINGNYRLARTTATAVGGVITKATPITAAPTNLYAITNLHKTLGDVSFAGHNGSTDGSWVWKAPQTALTADSSAKIQTFAAIFTPTDTANYDPTEVNISIGVSQVNITFPDTTMREINTIGGTAAINATVNVVGNPLPSLGSSALDNLVQWSSSNTNIITVTPNNNGGNFSATVTAKGKGIAFVGISIGGSSAASVMVKVNLPNTPSNNTAKDIDLLTKAVTESISDPNNMSDEQKKMVNAIATELVHLVGEIKDDLSSDTIINLDPLYQKSTGINPEAVTIVESGISTPVAPNSVKVQGMALASGQTVTPPKKIQVKITQQKPSQSQAGRNSQIEFKMVYTVDGVQQQLKAPLMITVPLPNGVSTQGLSIKHTTENGSIEDITLSSTLSSGHYTLSGREVTLWANSFSTFTFMTPIQTQGSSNADSGSSSNSAQYDFWERLPKQIKSAKAGDIIKISAGSYDKLPAEIMRTLYKEKVGISISWNGGKVITIPAGEALRPEGNRIYYPLSLLEKLYRNIKLVESDTTKPDASSPVNPRTGGSDYIAYADGKTIPVSGTVHTPAPPAQTPANDQVTVSPSDLTLPEPMVITPAENGFEQDEFADVIAENTAKKSGIWIAFAAIAASLLCVIGLCIWGKFRRNES